MGQVELVQDQGSKEVQFEPSVFKVNPTEIFPVTVRFKCEQAGIYRSQVQVSVEGFYNFQKTIDINATTVEFNRFLIDSQGHQLGNVRN